MTINPNANNSAKTTSRPKTVMDKDLKENTFVLVQGHIEYCRLLRPIQGEELEKDKRRKLQSGITPIEKPYTTITVKDARIVPLHKGMKSPEEAYVEERFWWYTNEGNNPTYHYSINNKSPYPNQFYQSVNNNPLEGNQFQPEAELANGLDVILILRIFQPSNFKHKGIGLHGVILQEPMRYYVGANTAALNNAGIILHNMPDAQPETKPEQNMETDVAPAAEAAPMFSTSPAPAPAAASQQNFGTPEGPWTCPNCGNIVPAGQAFCGSCGTKRADTATVSAGNPYANPVQDTASQSGIRFNPDSTARDY